MSSSEKPVRLRGSARTSTGRVRENNEDNLHLWMQNDSALAIIADGMGGAAAGEEASRLAVAAIQQGLVVEDEPTLRVIDALADDGVAQKMRDSIHMANVDILRRATDDPDMQGMGTTVTLAYIRNMRAIIAHVGDSRAYVVRQRDGTIFQITADHSFVEALVASGHITQEQAAEHPLRNVLYRALGQNEQLDIDVYPTRLRPHDRVILCSDGLTRHVSPSEIAEVALDSSNPDEISERLIDLANERGGEDNVSVIVIVVDGESVSRTTQEISLMKGSIEDTIVIPSTYLPRPGDTQEVDEVDDEETSSSVRLSLRRPNSSPNHAPRKHNTGEFRVPGRDSTS